MPVSNREIFPIGFPIVYTMPPETDAGKETSGKRLTPVMEQYHMLKKECGNSILFFQIGDFYETFWTDAEVVSRELDIVLTSRSKGAGGEKIPLAGVPCHAFDSYTARLVRKGYRVAVVDQVGDPKESKGIVKRQLTRVITPGTVIDPSMVTSTAAAYLMAIAEERNEGVVSAAFLDITTGEFFYSVCQKENHFQSLDAEIAKYHPGECIVSPGTDPHVITLLRERAVPVTLWKEEAFSFERAKEVLMTHFNVASLDGYGLLSRGSAIRALGGALSYAKETQGKDLPHITGISDRTVTGYMVLDAVTLRNLEVLNNIRDGGEDGTLKKTLDMTKTPMGSRLLVRCLTNPLLDHVRINARLDAVAYFTSHVHVRAGLRELLYRCSDISRIAGRISYGNAGPRDLVTLTSSLRAVPGIRSLLEAGTNQLPLAIQDALSGLRDHGTTIDLISRAIVDDPPATIKNGMVIREGYDKELDYLRSISGSGKDWIIQLQQEERETTGIKSLKVGYNSVFGYYIEVTKPNLHLVPPSYERKQTTSTGERFTIPSLREKEASIASADERLLAREAVLYSELLHMLQEVVPAIQSSAEGIGHIDLYASLAESARKYRYVRPNIDPGNCHLIREGRHPVVEQRMTGSYVPNDVMIDSSGEQVLIITGANMAGKSTYMRSVALITIMAQVGSFVPASYAEIGVVDRIFTRVGAFDDLSSGQSTFMVEMIELANILNNVTKKSLVILDEIGRGTSTLDGFCIARAVLEFLHGKGGAGPRTLFATHFHEIVGIESDLRRVRNYHFAVRDTGKEVVFLRKIIPGATDKSYGIHVAQIAGVPRKVIDRANTIMDEVEDRAASPCGKVKRYTQMLLVDTPAAQGDPVLKEIEELSVDTMTPLEALTWLSDLQKRLKSGYPGDRSSPSPTAGLNPPVYTPVPGNPEKTSPGRDTDTREQR